jgi:UDP-N-acetylmuramyl pentapeptide synthase
VWVEDVELRGLDGSRFTLCSKDERVAVELNLLGRGAVENLCAAATVCHMLGMGLQEIANAAPQLLPAPQRLNLFQLTPSLFLVDDCYNSSPASMRDSLELMVNVAPDYRKILVVGDMLELGKYETILHRQCALTALNLPFDAIYAVGPRMNAVNEVEGNEDIDLYYIEGRSDLEANGSFGSPDARFGQTFGGREPEAPTDKVIFDDRAAEKLSALLLNEVEQHNQPTVVLVKGSRALHLERVVNELLTGTNY